ncbi:MAG: class C sortase [Andreesenia angusta]|nr:class C sortase [Andreesenia angusta]
MDNRISELKEKLDRLLRSKKFLIGMLIIGLIIFIYPLISNYYYNLKQKNYANEYEKNIKGMSNEEIEKILNQAHNFNTNLFINGGLDILSESKYKYIIDSKKDKTYPSFFDDNELIATVEIPKIKTSLPIFVGVEDEILKKGSGFKLPSSLPVGGKSTHSILTAHRGLPESRLFRDLDQLKDGDIFFIKILGQTLAYKTDDKAIVLPSDFSRLNINEDKDEITLLTCHPYTINSHRLLVKGHRVEYNDTIKDIAKKQQRDNIWKLFFERYKEYIYGLLIFFIVFGIMRIKEKK